METRALGQGLQVQCQSLGIRGGTEEGNVTYPQERTHSRGAERCQDICQKDQERCMFLAEELQSKGKRPAVPGQDSYRLCGAAGAGTSARSAHC